MKIRRKSLWNNGFKGKIIAVIEKIFVDLSCEYVLSWKRPIILWLIFVILFLPYSIG